MSAKDNQPCFDSRKCFAKDKHHCCLILTSTYADGKCPFCKTNKDDKPPYKHVLEFKR